MKKFQKPDVKTVQRIRKLLSKDRKKLILSLICATVSSLLLLAIPLATGNAIDAILGKGQVDFPVVLQSLVFIAVCVGLTTLSQWLMSVINNKIAYGLSYRLRQEAFAKLQTIPLSKLDKQPIGKTVSRMISDVDAFSDGLLMALNQFFTGILTILGTLTVMLVIRPSIAAIVVLITPLSLFAASFIANRTYALFHRQSEIRAEQTSWIEESVSNHAVVTAFGQEDARKNGFDEINGRLEKASLLATFYSSTVNPTTRFINNLIYAGVALLGALLCFPIGGAVFTVGKLTAFLSYANQYTKPFNEISGVLAELQSALASAARVFELLDTESEAPDSSNTYPVFADGRIAFQNVCFSYTPEKKTLQDLNFTVKPGQRVAIVGHTGCGKTTLINLLMRFYDVTDGSITVGGTDLRNLKKSSLRAAWGMVLQDTWLRNATVAENISIGKPNATREEIENAAKAVRADSFIRRLPNGYDTVLGEGGASLSQGQKQLLCIARVMLAPPPMLILDEATSSIDTRMERKIQDAFAKLMQGRTSFIVAHRLSTIENADLILVMDQGRIIEQGSHSELLRKQGYYANLYNSQF